MREKGLSQMYFHYLYLVYFLVHFSFFPNSFHWQNLFHFSFYATSVLYLYIPLKIEIDSKCINALKALYKALVISYMPNIKVEEIYPDHPILGKAVDYVAYKY